MQKTQFVVCDVLYFVFVWWSQVPLRHRYDMRNSCFFTSEPWERRLLRAMYLLKKIREIMRIRQQWGGLNCRSTPHRIRVLHICGSHRCSGTRWSIFTYLPCCMRLFCLERWVLVQKRGESHNKHNLFPSLPTNCRTSLQGNRSRFHEKHLGWYFLFAAFMVEYCLTCSVSAWFLVTLYAAWRLAVWHSTWTFILL